ncbi:MAG: aldehyde dehydrogenase family protein [Solirubrobacterales bacterium]
MGETEREHGLYIDGAWQAPARTFESIDPTHPERVLGHFSAATPAEVGQALAAAKAAARSWARTPAPARGEILHAAAERLAREREEFAATIVQEEGKTIDEARGEMARAVSVLRWFAGEASQPSGATHPSAREGTLVYSLREPLGVVAVITPWNFPVAIPAWKIAPALAFGNAVVWKPSELTPLCAVLLTELLEAAGLPPGVLNLITGDPAEIGDVLVDGPEVDAISFTGSLRVGRHIQTRAVPRGVKVQLETGGKNPAIVMDDADLERAVELVVRGAMWSTGQKCTASSRALVTPGIAPAFTEALLERVGGLRVGDPLAPETEIGPLVSAPQRERVRGYLERAAGEGQQPVTEARPEVEQLPGFFVAPTVYTDVDPATPLAQEEVFGPVLAVLEVADLEQALEIAEGVEFGLSASIFTRDLATALRFAGSIKTGMVHVNRETAGAEPQAPFGGAKASSSHSREQGKAAADFYTELKTVYIDP